MAIIRLTRPKVVAAATDKYLTPTHLFNDSVNLPRETLRYGQDITFALNRSLPAGNPPAASDENSLIPYMRELLNQFAGDDRSGMAKRLFDRFLAPECRAGAQYFDDASLNLAAKNHTNIKYFCKAALNKPSASVSNKTRIHQALKNANWDINQMVVPRDLGVPAFNKGNKAKPFRSEDFTNGLGVMINGVQHAYVVARDYQYDSTRRKYDITLRYLFYDVFGLDDDDLKEYGADGGIELNPGATWGITAWWQLQHQYAYAPFVTRIKFDITHRGVSAV